MSLELDTSTPALLVKARYFGVQHGALGVARSLGALGAPVWVVVDSARAPLSASRFVEQSFVSTSDDPENLTQELAGIGATLDRRAVLIATDDKSSVIVAEHADRLRPWFLFPTIREDLPRRLADKSMLYELCKLHGAPCPESALVSSIDDVNAFIERAKFPVIVKAAEHDKMLHNGSSTMIVQSPAELLSFFRASPWTARTTILQEFIPGEDWIFHGYRNPESGVQLSFTGRKLSSYPSLAGLTATGLSLSNEPLQRQIEDFLSTIGYAGIMDIDCRLDHRDGRYKILDFNPRVGANFRMFETSGGADVARALHLDMTGGAVSLSPMIQGRTFLVEPYALSNSLIWMRSGPRVFAPLRQLLQGSMEFAWWSWKDPKPFVALSARLLLRRTQRMAQRAHSVASGPPLRKVDGPAFAPRSTFRKLLYSTIRWSGGSFLLRQCLWRRRAVILYYHDPKPDVLDAHLTYLERVAKVVSLRELVDSFPEGRVAAITIDDGAIGNLALEETFQKHEVRPTIFVCTGITSCGSGYWWTRVTDGALRERMKRLPTNRHKIALEQMNYEQTRPANPRQALSVGEIRSMLPWADIGAHTRFHPILTQCDDDECRDEIFGSRRELADSLGFELDGFAYPNGDYGEREMGFVKDAGFRYARTCDPGWICSSADPFQLNGIMIDDGASLDKFSVQLTGLPSLLSAYARRLSNARSNAAMWLFGRCAELAQTATGHDKLAGWRARRDSQ